jgi:hypothetical protein
LKSHFINIHPHKQRYNSPVRYTLFKGFLDNTLRFGGSYLVKLNKNACLNIKRSTIIFKRLDKYKKKCLMFFHFGKNINMKDYGLLFKKFNLL